MKLCIGTLLVVLAAALAACGAGTGGGATENFSAKADAICKSRAAEALPVLQSNPRSARDAAARAGRLASIAQRYTTQLRTLKAPLKVRAAYESFLRKQRQLVSLLRRAQSDARRGDRAAVDRDQRRYDAVAISSESDAARARLRICAAKLPAADEKTIRTMVHDAELDPSRFECTEHVTRHFIEALFGGSVRACRKRIARARADSVTIGHVSGVLPAASVELTETRGGRTRHLTIYLIKRGGRWKLDDVARR